MTGWVDKGRAVDVVYLDFSKAFSTVSQDILLGKLRNCGLDEWSVRWVENWLNGRTQRVVITGAESSWRPISNGVPQGLVLTESQNHRMLGVGRDLCGSSSPTLLPNQARLQ